MAHPTDAVARVNGRELSSSSSEEEEEEEAPAPPKPRAETRAELRADVRCWSWMWHHAAEILVTLGWARRLSHLCPPSP